MTDANAIREFLREKILVHAARAGIRQPRLADDTDVLEAGLIDSMELIHLLSELELTFGITLDFSEASPEQLQTIGGLVDWCAKTRKT